MQSKERHSLQPYHDDLEIKGQQEWFQQSFTFILAFKDSREPEYLKALFKEHRLHPLTMQAEIPL